MSAVSEIQRGRPTQILHVTWPSSRPFWPLLCIYWIVLFVVYPNTNLEVCSFRRSRDMEGQCFFVTVRACTAYRKIWLLDNNFFARIISLTVQKFQLFWVIFCIIIFFIELWHILISWLAKMPNGGMPVFTLIATGWRHQNMRTGKYCFTKKHCRGGIKI